MFKTNGELRKENVGENVVLHGFVSKVRKLGGLVFVDLRDMHGITQVVFKPSFKNFELAEKLSSEDTIEVSGKVVNRESINKDLPTGDIEVIAKDLKIFSKAMTPPIIIKDDDTSQEETRLKYRYLDLRKPKMKNYIIMRSKIVQAFREALLLENFLELDTPILSKSTPEGARDYLVPSRLYKGSFYALPQSPQIYKQLYMIAGFDNYFQIAKCLRDEDLRADRQPEFSQIDIEKSYTSEKDIFSLSERIFKYVFKKILNIDLKTPFKIMDYKDAINNYGIDRPDLRFDLKIKDYTKIFKESNIEFLKKEEVINGLVIKDKNGIITRKKIDEYINIVKKYKAQSIAWVKKTKEGLAGSISKLVDEKILNEISLKNDECLLIVADNYKVVKSSLGALRNKLAKDFNLVKNDEYSFLWINNFPLFEKADDGSITSTHHPFTLPKGNLYTEDPLKLSSYAYDLVLNGYELSSGSMRIYDSKMQEEIFKILNLSTDEIKNRFGFFTEAFKYGVPPHGGIAFGVERIVMLITKTDNIKDVVAFPKTQSARDLMNDSPSVVSKKQLEELYLEVKND